MNIKITYNWLREYIDTDASPYELQKYLSLCGPSVEKVEKVGNDYVLDIEITSNRIDMASVWGIAQEASAILPMFNRKAKLLINPLTKYKFSSLNKGKFTYNCNILIKDIDICRRITAIILDSIKIKSSPNLIKERLEMCDIRSINNIVDISNYITIALGQPNHIFDYDKIPNAKLILRLSKKGEKIKTLDGKNISLLGSDIVIENDNGKLTDLAGIMGGYDSQITSSTTKILFLLENYEKSYIRKTSMQTGQRTQAASYFEKGIDPERIEPALIYGIELLKQFACGEIASDIHDIYNFPIKQKSINVDYEKITNIIGVPISKQKIVSILESLGFTFDNNQTHVYVPSYRANDIILSDDLIEEVARIYGYANVIGKMQRTDLVSQPQSEENLFNLKTRLRTFFKDIGFNEVINYSLISKKDIINCEHDEKLHLPLTNPINKDLMYLRRTLLPGLLNNISRNQNKKPNLYLFEIGRVFKPRHNNLPYEIETCAVISNNSYFHIKSALDAIIKMFNIKNIQIIPDYEHKLMSKSLSSQILFNQEVIGYIGLIKPKISDNMGCNGNIYFAQFNIQKLSDNTHMFAEYIKPLKYARISFDLTYKSDSNLLYKDIENKAYELCSHLVNINLRSIYKDKITLRFEFSSRNKNITEKEVRPQFDKIKAYIFSR